MCCRGNEVAGEVPCEEAFVTTGIHRERSKIEKLIQQFTEELEAISGQHKGSKHGSCDLFEVFCNSTSQLTAQCQKLGGQAFRFGYDQGDLKTIEGRKKLFIGVCCKDPRNIWFAPSCHPWCAWSQLNGSKSEAAWADMVDRRETHLYQIALGIVLHRWQRNRHRHFRGNNPKDR